MYLIIKAKGQISAAADRPARRAALRPSCCTRVVSVW